MKALPTREQCQAIVAAGDTFFCEEKLINGFKVELYSYRLANYSDFDKLDAYELRGLCFIYDPNTEQWNRNILLDKFFNYAQVIGWMPADLDDLPIVRVQDKLDGSVISFVKFPDGSVRAKSKMSFDSEQAQLAQRVYTTDLNIQNAVLRSFFNNETLIFELTSPLNPIVVDYQETNLILLQVRSNDTGQYCLDLEPYKSYYRVKTPLPSTLSLQELLALKASNKDNIEGWVVTFANGKMAKVKTDHYLSLHGLIGPDAYRENLLIKTIVNDSIDDVLAALPEGPKKERIQTLTTQVQHKYNSLVVDFKTLRYAYFNVFNEDRKAFALRYSKATPVFGYVMKTLNTSFRDVEQTASKAIKELILKRTKSLTDAKEWLQHDMV